MHRIKVITSALIYSGTGFFMNNLGCFELIEMNYLVDDQITPWLISVKRNTDITCRTKAQRELIPNLIQNVYLNYNNLLF